MDNHQQCNHNHEHHHGEHQHQHGEHQHQHGEHQHHHHQDDKRDVNQKKFDSAANSWENPQRVDMANKVSAAMINRLDEYGAPLDADSIVMDFGCGTGLVTMNIRDKVKHVVSVDNSDGMLNVLRTKCSSIEPNNITPVNCDLLTEPLKISNGSHPYPLSHIVGSMVLHHVQDVPALFKSFSSHLAPGGTVTIVDLDANAEEFHPDNSGVHHFGFVRGTLEGWLKDAGFGAITFYNGLQTLRNALGTTKTFTMFLVVARKF